MPKLIDTVKFTRGLSTRQGRIMTAIDAKVQINAETGYIALQITPNSLDEDSGTVLVFHYQRRPRIRNLIVYKAAEL